MDRKGEAVNRKEQRNYNLNKKYETLIVSESQNNRKAEMVRNDEINVVERINHWRKSRVTEFKNDYGSRVSEE
jgi:DNA/RNA-binding domain of Phe-tRNA-synthetase-like protein